MPSVEVIDNVGGGSILVDTWVPDADLHCNNGTLADNCHLEIDVDACWLIQIADDNSDGVYEGRCPDFGEIGTMWLYFSDQLETWLNNAKNEVLQAYSDGFQVLEGVIDDGTNFVQEIGGDLASGVDWVDNNVCDSWYLGWVC